MINNKKIGVGLSGGGYRAAGYHIGTLRKLKEMNLLDKVDFMSTISGGSIIGAAYSLHKGDFKSFEDNMIKAVTTKSVIKYILTSWLFIRFALLCLLFLGTAGWLFFTHWAPLSLIPLAILIYLLVSYQFKLLLISRIIEHAYNDFFYDKATLSALGNQPELVIGSTNLQTSRPFSYTNHHMGDSSYTYMEPPILFKHADFPVTRAVMASSCVPFAFTPVSIEPKYFVDHDVAVAAKVDPQIVDGGVYDNQGIQKITQDSSSYSCDIVIISDAGNKLPFNNAYNNTFTLLLRTVDTFMIRIKNFQMANNIFLKPNKREVAYQSIGWDLDKCLPGFYENLVKGYLPASVTSAHELPEAWVKEPAKYKEDILKYMDARCHVAEIVARGLDATQLAGIRNIGTNLTPIKEGLVKDMITHAENTTELQVRLYCPSIL